MMDATIPQVDPMPNQPTDSVFTGEVDETTPWGDFRSRFTVLDVLTSAGWKVVKESTDMISVLRPGDTKAETSGVIFKDSGLFSRLPRPRNLRQKRRMIHSKRLLCWYTTAISNPAIRDLRNDGFGQQSEPQGIPDDALFDYDNATEEEIDEMTALLKSLETDSTQEIEEPEKPSR